MKYFKNEIGIYATDADEPVQGGVPATEQEITDYLNRSDVPQSVTMRQARLALLQSGLLANVDAAINSLSSPQKEAAQIEWEYSQEVQRDNELLALLAPALGLDDAQLDALFVLASTL